MPDDPLPFDDPPWTLDDAPAGATPIPIRQPTRAELLVDLAAASGELAKLHGRQMPLDVVQMVARVVLVLEQAKAHIEREF